MAKKTAKKTAKKKPTKKECEEAQAIFDDFVKSLKKMGINVMYRDTWIEKRAGGLTKRDRKMLDSI